MDRIEAEPVAKNLISKAKILMKDAKMVDDDYWAFTAFDNKWELKPEFRSGEKGELLKQIYDVISKLDYDSQVCLYFHITSVEIAAERQMMAQDGWQNPAALDKMACILLRNVRLKVEHENNSRKSLFK